MYVEIASVYYSVWVTESETLAIKTLSAVPARSTGRSQGVVFYGVVGASRIRHRSTDIAAGNNTLIDLQWGRLSGFVLGSVITTQLGAAAAWRRKGDGPPEVVGLLQSSLGVRCTGVSEELKVAGELD